MTKFYYPPRPAKAIAPGLIKAYESMGWVAQLKKNGTGSSVTIDPEGGMVIKTRHAEDHKAWKPTAEVCNFFGKFRDSAFAFELLHSKGPEVKDTAYVYDVMRLNGEDLIGVDFTERMRLLHKFIPMTDKVVIAEVHTRDLSGLYHSLSSPLDEGIVLKDPRSTLASCIREGTNEHWQVKCRRKTKNFAF